MFTRVNTFLFVLCLSLFVSASWGAKLCLDPGHGGTDPGAVGCGQYEDTNNLNTALKFRNWLNADTNDGAGGAAWSVSMTRTTDVFITLQGRCDISNSFGADRFMSNHNNACCGGTGTSTYSYSATDAGADLRNKEQYRVVQAWGLRDRGNFTANYYVLVYTNAPATLAELGFIDNCTLDATFVGNATRQDSAALGLLYAAQTHFGVGAYKPGSAVVLPTYTLDNANAGFACSANWATGTGSTDKYGTNYRYKSTAAISDAASFSINVGVAGTYKIYAWWPAGTNRSTTAPFILPAGGTVNVNQQINGGKWNLIGTQSLATGARVTKLSCWTTTGFVVMADAVRYAP